MINRNNIQKKKSTLTVLLNILFKILLLIAVSIFAYIIYDKADFSTNNLEFKSSSNNTSKSDSPRELIWFDDFKGIENVPNKKMKKEENSSNDNTGFRYEGFKK